MERLHTPELVHHTNDRWQQKRRGQMNRGVSKAKNFANAAKVNKRFIAGSTQQEFAAGSDELICPLCN